MELASQSTLSADNKLKVGLIWAPEALGLAFDVRPATLEGPRDRLALQTPRRKSVISSAAPLTSVDVAHYRDYARPCAIEQKIRLIAVIEEGAGHAIPSRAVTGNATNGETMVRSVGTTTALLTTLPKSLATDFLPGSLPVSRMA